MQGIGDRLSRRRALQLVAGGGAAAFASQSRAAAFGFNNRADGSAAAAMPAPFTPCATGAYPDGFRRARPESVGIDPSSILDFLDDLEANHIEMNSFMLYRHGAVVAEGWWWPYRPDLVHMMHSLTKSVTVSAVGMALAQGKFKLTDKVVSFYPDELPAQVSDNLAAMTVEDLLTMRTGHDHQTSGSAWRPIKTSWVAEFYKIPVVYKPGTKWVYTSAATYMLSAIFSKTMGTSVYEYLKPTFFQPLGISSERWAPGPQDITPGANGLSWHTADSLKLGVLYLQQGNWNGRQILPPGWVQECHKPSTPGIYGYQWWLGPGEVYYADGMFGQFSFVWPGHDAVFACTAAIQDDNVFPPILYKHFPRGFQASVKPNPAAMSSLAAKLDTLRLLPSLKPSNSPVAAQISGRTFHCEENDDGVETVRLDFTGNICVFNLRDARGDHEIKCGLGDWIESFTTMTGDKLHHEYQPDIMRVVAGGIWKDPQTIELTWCFNESSFRDTVVCRFDGRHMTFDRRVNVNSAALARPTVRGVRE